MEPFSLSYALLAVQNALLGAITPELRAVVVDIDPKTKTFYIHIYYHGPVFSDQIEAWRCVITESSADLGPDHALDNGIHRLDYPSAIPYRGRYAYLRKE